MFAMLEIELFELVREGQAHGRLSINVATLHVTDERLPNIPGWEKVIGSEHIPGPVIVFRGRVDDHPSDPARDIHYVNDLQKKDEILMPADMDEGRTEVALLNLILTRYGYRPTLLMLRQDDPTCEVFPGVKRGIRVVYLMERAGRLAR